MYQDRFRIDDYEKWRKVDFKYPMIFKPCRILEPYVSYYWLSIFTGTENEAQRLKPKTVTLIPDGGSSIIFDINYKQNWHHESIWGVMDKPMVVYNQHSISKGETMTFGVDFKPIGLYRFLNIPMWEFTNNSPELNSVSYSTFHQLAESMVNAESIGEQIHTVESFLIKQLNKVKSSQSPVMEALYTICETSGSIRVSELASRLFISERSLRRLFRDCVGISPKTLCRITRLQSVMKNCMGDKQLNFLMAAYDNGYFDQSHFIKDFREFCGYTPGQYKKL
ncbi:MAG TPA: helix-turn-helix domain-containing protein [Clostridia bacterium]|nr:helix-turn-helix domain-containing protein [Clostridia bacterium]